MPTRPRKALPEPARSSDTLVHRAKPGQTAAEAAATAVVSGLASNSVATRNWSLLRFGDVDATACLKEVVDAAGRVNRGDTGQLEAVLTAHVITLNAIFAELAERARTNMGEHFDAMERYLRLALKAQGQCRSTVESLAVLKNPPTVFARQANIAHGPQQVNNSLRPPDRAPSFARAENHEIEQNKLLEPGTHAERMDGRTADATGARHQALATVGTVNGPADGRGEGAIGEERGSRRSVPTGSREARHAEPVTRRRP